MLVVTRCAIHSSDLGLGDLEALPLDLLAQDGDARLEVGPADVDDHALAEARAQALLELLELARRPVAGDHDLLAGLVQRVERVEELDLRLLLLGEELHVVDDQHVVVAVGLLEALDAALVGDRVDEVVGEALAGDVPDLELGVLLERRVGDRLGEVGLAEAGVGVDEHRVVGGRRRLGDAAGDGRRVLVVGAGDEAVEDVARVEVAGGLGRGSAAAACRRSGGRGACSARLRARRPPAPAPLGQRRRARVDDDADLDGVAEDLLERLGDLAGEALLDPLAGEVVGHADDEGAVVEAERHGAVEPELEGGVVEAAAKVLLRLVPDECELVVRRCPVELVPGDAAARRGSR